jgi:hypothetical protein
MHKGAEAAAEFQKIVDHGGANLGNDLGPPELRTALLALLSGNGPAVMRLPGDTASAKKTLQDFFELWKDADPDIPVLKQAKAEYAKLN